MERRERGRKKWIERKRREDKGIRLRTKPKKERKGRLEKKEPNTDKKNTNDEQETQRMG